MRVRALRGVCIGVDRHLAPGDTADLEAAQVTYLAAIGAVEPVPDTPVPVDQPEAPATATGPDTAEQSSAAGEPADITSETPAPARSGKKEK